MSTLISNVIKPRSGNTVTFSSCDVSIGGTLTYEDVTNIDSVGIITAQTGVKVTAGGVDVTAGGLNVTAGVGTFKGILNADAEVTAAGGVDVAGGLKVAGISTFAGVIDIGNVDVTLDGTAAGVTSVTWDASANSLIFNDSSIATFGDSSDLQVYHQDSINYLKTTNASAPIQLQAPAGEVLAKFIPNGADELYHNGSKKIETTTTGVTVTGAVTDSKGDVRDIPKNTQGSSYTLVAADSGKFIEATGTAVVLPASIFSAGNAITIVNQTAGNITITQDTGLTLYNAADGTSGSLTLSTRGIATVLYASGSTAHISGNLS